MNWLKRHLRNTFLTGVFSAIPIVITVVVVWYVEKLTREPLKALFGVDTPFLGVAVAIAVIYVLGVLVNSILGRYLLRWLDVLLRKVPVLKDIYEAWKQITLTPGGKEGMYAKVVLIPGDREASLELGFTSGDGVEGNPELCCVFVPGTPNPTAGRLVFVARDRCVPLDISAEEAFKFALSGGNYVPATVGPRSLGRLPVMPESAP
ncbi:MAG: DUF502 domain-containing protein [Nannocystis sp.]|nr:DUF502 domain-containing protein [Nannocystis sp.]MBA3547720.1 DUF502 domain-containing protein [Nannocystis sp.]